MIKAIIFDFFGTVRTDGRVDPDLLDFIGELKKHYKTGLLSNVIGLENYFESKLGAQYFDIVAASDRIGFAKPTPEAYLYVLDKLGVKPNEAIMVDDLPLLVQGARNIGMQGILYKNMDRLRLDIADILESNKK